MKILVLSVMLFNGSLMAEGCQFEQPVIVVVDQDKNILEEETAQANLGLEPSKEEMLLLLDLTPTCPSKP